jgi:hypothetical protein
MAQYQGKPLVKGNELLLVLQKYLSGWNLSRQKFLPRLSEKGSLFYAAIF